VIRRRTALRAAAVCASVFAGVMLFDVTVVHPRLGGDRVCMSDSGAAALYGVDGPGVYTFSSTGRPVRIPATMALGMVVGGVFKSPYSGYSACGARALTQTADGVIVLVSVLGTVAALVAAAFATRPTPSASQPAAS